MAGSAPASHLPHHVAQSALRGACNSAVTLHKKTTRFHVRKRGNVRRYDNDELLRTVFLNEAPSYVKNQGGLGAEPPEKKWVLHAPDDACCTFAALEFGFCFDAKLRF